MIYLYLESRQTQISKDVLFTKVHQSNLTTAISGLPKDVIVRRGNQKVAALAKDQDWSRISVGAGAELRILFCIVEDKVAIGLHDGLHDAFAGSG